MSQNSTTKGRFPRIVFGSCTFITLIFILFSIGMTFYIASPIILREGLNFFTGTGMNFESGQYGISIYIIDTIILAAITIIFALPLSILTSIFLSEYAPPALAGVIRPMIELLVGIPSVVYGIFGYFILGDIVRNYVKPFITGTIGFIPIFHDNTPQTGSGMFLAAIVLSIMILPTIISLSEEALRSVPREHREASYALGATKEETIFKVVIPAASSGIISAFILGLMRAMGETMAVVMLIGNYAQVPQSIFDSGYVLTSVVLNEITFYFPFDDPRSALFGVVAFLFIIEIAMVAVARYIARRKYS